MNWSFSGVEDKDPDVPLVSIVIPCFNSREVVREAVDSAYQQTYRSIEVVVVDDGSTDGSLEMLYELKKTEYPDLKVLRHPDGCNRGVSLARYLGVKNAKGKYIALLDADDTFEPDKLKQQVFALERQPEVVLCHTGVTVIGDRSRADAYERNFARQKDEVYDFRRQKDYLKRNGICNSSVLVRAIILRKVPFEMPQLFQYEDWLCWSLLAFHGDFLFVSQPLTRYRVHTESATSAVQKDVLRAGYSRLEMRLALAARSESGLHSIRVLFAAFGTVAALTRTYAERRGDYMTSETRRPNGLIILMTNVGRCFRRAQKLAGKIRQLG